MLLFKVVAGAEAVRWSLHNADRWDALYLTCQSQNVFLSRPFAQTWYEHYKQGWEPVLLIGESADGELLALTPLACSTGDAILTGAGAHQAEYQGWLCAPALHRELLTAGLDALFARYPRHRLELRYLADPSAIEAAEKDQRRRLEVARSYRPVLDIDRKQIKASQNKKGNKSKLNRLRRTGPLEFRRVHTADELEGVFDEVIEAYDFRQGGSHGVLPFAEDPQKKAFHLAWMRTAPEQLHVTCLIQHERPIATLIGVAGGSEIGLAIHCYLPQLAANSPGKLLIYETASALAEQGVQVLDLTPGGDPWKDKVASRTETVIELRAYRNAYQRLLAVAPERARAALRRSLKAAGLQPSKLREAIARMRRLKAASVRDRLANLLPRTTDYLVYRFALENRNKPPQAFDVRVNSLSALIDLAERLDEEGIQERQEFLAEAARRLENGNQSYVLLENGRPVHYRWLVPKQVKSRFSEVDYSYTYPEPGPVCFDSYTLPSGRGKGYSQAVLSQILYDLAHVKGERFAYTSVLADNGPSRHIIEKLDGRIIARIRRNDFLWWNSASCEAEEPVRSGPRETLTLAAGAAEAG
jgi:CelD/BcsL family acetyltransferase involved in cellulose biosynthesis/RimJ/RimL family protein N-acetyltransferase